MKIWLKALVGAALVFVSAITPTAHAGLNAEIDLTNPRVVPYITQMSP